MVMIANLQYGWTLFVNPINKAHGWSIAVDPVRLRHLHCARDLAHADRGLDRRHARPATRPEAHGRVRRRLGRARLGHQCLRRFARDALSRRHFSGIGGGAVYATCVGHGGQMVPGPARPCGRPDRGGLWRGRGAHRHSDPLCDRDYGYQPAFLWFGIVQGGVVFLLALLLRGPDPGEMAGAAAPKVAQSARSFSPREVLITPVFWLLYVMFVMVSASGLMATAQIAPIAKDFNVGNQIFLGRDDADRGADHRQSRQRRGAAAVRLDLRPYRPRKHHGDRLRARRRRLLAAGAVGTAPWAFVLFAALIFLTWGEIFSLFPSTCTDTFGPKFATVNLSLLYTAKGASAFLVPVANLIKDSTGSWHMVFVVTAI